LRCDPKYSVPKLSSHRLSFATTGAALLPVGYRDISELIASLIAIVGRAERFRRDVGSGRM
jgi:hypothetical protein